MSRADLVTALTRGSEMRKAWEGGPGGSNRLVQCLVGQGQACLVYGRGWLRKSVQHPIDRCSCLTMPHCLMSHVYRSHVYTHKSCHDQLYVIFMSSLFQFIIG